MKIIFFLLHRITHIIIISFALRKLFVESWKFTFFFAPFHRSRFRDCWYFICDEAMMRKFYAVLFIFTSFRNSRRRRLSSRCCTFYYCCGLVDWLQRSSFLLAKTIFNDHTQKRAARGVRAYNKIRSVGENCEKAGDI